MRVRVPLLDVQAVHETVDALPQEPGEAVAVWELFHVLHGAQLLGESSFPFTSIGA